MTPHDQTRLAALISEFIDGCGFDLPLHVIAIGSNGSISVSRHTDSGVEQICGHNAECMVSPITVAVVAQDGRGSSAKIEIIEAARGRMQ